MIVFDWLQMDYFDVYNGFAAIGGISLMVFWFVALAMLQCEAGTDKRYRSLHNILVFSLFLCM